MRRDTSGDPGPRGCVRGEGLCMRGDESKEVPA